MAGGKGAVFRDEADPLAKEPFLAIAILDGTPKEGRIRLAAPIMRAQIEELFGDQIEERDRCVWDSQSNTVLARRQRSFGAVILEDRPWKNATPDAIAAAALEGLRQLGIEALPWEGAAEQLRARVEWLRAYGAEVDLPDWSNAALEASYEDWLLPHLGRTRTKADFGSLPLARILADTLQWDARETLDQMAPVTYRTPAGTSAKIDYLSDPPALEVRIQEMFGESRHPAIGRSDVPLLIRFLSPARRPVQVTGDLPGFWANSYTDVRKDLRGRYPKHPWPEDPLVAAPTARAKPRKR